ncbi:hypothetical protein DPEC_G00287520 [Dallia pectoralis]|uniref:Uncharacterized protein n=1 Tax=Dallia pectoralis TaxID=75939 RepID=A0ACC2FKM9_DALPE|nr:hypothetical protein DPEC_G00287520 [Dallia pectoralis]
MDLIVEKIKELDISWCRDNGQYRRLTSPKTDPDPDDDTRAGEKGFADRLRVRSKVIETTPSRQEPSRSDLLPKLGTTNPGCSQRHTRAPDRRNTAVCGGYTLNPEPKPLIESNSPGADPNPMSPRATLLPWIFDFRGLPCGEADAAFIRAVTATELVCGQVRYKCSGCLRYYDNMATLLGHVDHGWREGFSCGLFYRRLMSMRERRPVDTPACQRTAAQGPYNDPELYGSSVARVTSASQNPAARPVDGGGWEDNELKKDDMIHTWLQTTEMAMSLF